MLLSLWLVPEINNNNYFIKKGLSCVLFVCVLSRVVGLARSQSESKQSPKRTKELTAQRHRGTEGKKNILNSTICSRY